MFIHGELVEDILVNPYNRILCTQTKQNKSKDAPGEAWWKDLQYFSEKCKVQKCVWLATLGWSGFNIK